MADWISCPAYEARIYLSGPIAVAEQVCREDCLREGLCVTVTPTKFIYSGGEEEGYVVGLVNYPRFPSDPGKITARAKHMAKLLMERTCQWSALVTTPDLNEWLTCRPETP